MSAFRVKLGTNGLNYVDVPLNSTHSLTQARIDDVTEILIIIGIGQRCPTELKIRTNRNNQLFFET